MSSRHSQRLKAGPKGQAFEYLPDLLNILKL